ncbi:MAG: hypothetical protein QOE65_111 [Solirubrobacteraceae bacterium]|jgi:hypothetical protein|nr:hypothetical protein [Solirubrobacteraceae bacterium]
MGPRGIDPATRRRAIRIALAILALVVAGALLVTLSDRRAADLAGITLLGAALVGLVAWAFLEVGLSEDAERERERRD